MKPIVIAILDGWGHAPAGPANAIELARKPVFDRLWREHPHTLLQTSGPAVGLPAGQMGNSEVGHLNIGAGRVVQMDVTRIDQAISNGEFFRNPVLLEAMRQARGHQLHLLGLVSDGGVHSHISHLEELLRLAREQQLTRVFVHAFTDGRDTMPESGQHYLRRLLQTMREVQTGEIATVSGRYYAMDRDRRWERIQLAYAAMTQGAGPRLEMNAADPRQQAGNAAEPAAVRVLLDSYARGVTDEFIIPTVLTRAGEPVAVIRPDDVCINFNYRADRARQITRALTRAGEAAAPDAEALESALPSSQRPQPLHYVCMTRYDKNFGLPTVIPPESLDNILAKVLGDRGLRNLRVAETEKYAHVTYFFNGGVETPFPGEEREMIPSPKVATYDLQPAMSAEKVAARVIRAIEKEPFSVIVVNFANADMVGHSGRLAPTIQAVEAVDAGLGEIHAALRRSGGSLLVTADHGNAEQMVDPATGGPHTAHTTNPVPLILVNSGQNAPAGAAAAALRAGSLRDIAPTALGLLHLPEPPQMTGSDLTRE